MTSSTSIGQWGRTTTEEPLSTQRTVDRAATEPESYMPTTIRGDSLNHRLDYPVFDADNHMYEQKDTFTRYLPSKSPG